MAIKDIFKVSRKTFFNPTGWFGADNLGIIFKGGWEITQRLFVPAKDPVRKETFEEAVKRFNLTEEDIIQKQENYLLFAYILGICGIFSFGFSFYLLFFHSTFAGFLLGLATAAIFFSQAFRFHFWFFETKHRKLGCTLDEWWQGKLHTDSEAKHD
ncbi:MAG: type IVB secretion system protein IcmV [Gammaproteobacteria bacterium]|nr:type IVB secretion system protein IcmV [Gammaproteobacteria bacterium]